MSNRISNKRKYLILFKVVLISLSLFVSVYAGEIYDGYDNGGNNGVIESVYKPEEEWQSTAEAVTVNNEPDYIGPPAEDSATPIEETSANPVITPEGEAGDVWQWVSDIGKFIGDRVDDALGKIEELGANIVALGLNGDNAIREKATQILGDMGEPGIKTLISALDGSNQEVRDTILQELSSIIKYKGLSTAEQEQIVAPLLDLIADKNLDPKLKSDILGISWGIMASAPKTDDAVKERIKESIATNVINEKNKLFWEEFGVVVLETERPLKEGESSAIYAVLSSLTLPQATLLPVISLEREGRANSDAKGDYIYATAVAVLGGFRASDNFRTARTIFHETGHRIDFINQISYGQKDDWSKLSEGSNNRYDYVSAYGSTNISEDFATMFEAYTNDTAGLLAQAKENALGGRGDILLQKAEFIAKIFGHTVILADGKPAEYTYIFKTEENGAVSRKEVPLATTKLR